MGLVLQRRQFLELVVQRHAVDGVLPAPGFIGKAPLRDRVKPRQQRIGLPLAAPERGCCVGENLLGKVLRPVRVARLSPQVAIDLRMVSPEGQFGEAFHYFPCRSATGKVTGFDDGICIARRAALPTASVVRGATCD